MFDGAARLVLCNDRYIEMYHLRPEHARAGTPLHDLLMHRLAAGNFAGDVDRYVADCLKQVAEGRTETKTTELKDGRIIAVVSRPMRGGGWVATHTDVTDQLLRREGARFAAPARRAAPLDRCRDLFVPGPGRDRAQDRQPKRERDEVGGEDAVDDVGSYAAARRGRGARLQRGLDQCRNRGGGGRRTLGLDPGDQPPARPGQRRRAQRRRRRHRDQRGYRRAGACGAEDRRRGQAHSGHRRPDQSAGAQRHHRGGARRRSRARFRRGRLRSEIARGADRQGDRRDHARDHVGAGIERQSRRGDPRDHAAHAGHQQLYQRGRHFGRAAGSGDRRDFPQRRQRRDRRQGYRRGFGRSRRRRDADALSAQTMLAASEEVENATEKLRREVEEFLGTVAA